MAYAGASYTITLCRSHLEWGTYRFTGTRNQIYGEGYIPIPAHVARSLNLLNNNGTGDRNVPGVNIFNCVSADGFYHGHLRAQGCKSAGDIYAKQFAGDKALKAIGSWYAQIGAQVGDMVRVTWTSATDIIIEKL